MDYFAGLDVSVKETSVCVVDDAGKIVREARVITARRLKAGSSICAPQCGRAHRPQPAALPREGWLPAVRPQSSRVRGRWAAHSTIAVALTG